MKYKVKKIEPEALCQLSVTNVNLHSQTNKQGVEVFYCKFLVTKYAIISKHICSIDN